LMQLLFESMDFPLSILLHICTASQLPSPIKQIVRIVIINTDWSICTRSVSFNPWQFYSNICRAVWWTMGLNLLCFLYGWGFLWYLPEGSSPSLSR
jgi:hypothetical protein